MCNHWENSTAAFTSVCAAPDLFADMESFTSWCIKYLEFDSVSALCLEIWWFSVKALMQYDKLQY